MRKNIKELSMNKIKRLLSCFCLLILGLFSGLQANSAIVKLPKQSIKQTDNLFYLYTGKNLQQNAFTDKAKLADHMSHMSHSSHSSHYSSHY